MLTLQKLVTFLALGTVLVQGKKKKTWNGYQMILPSAQNSYNGTGSDGNYTFNMTFASWTKKESLNKKKYVQSAETTWTNYVTGNWYDDYYTFSPSTTAPTASRVWQYNNGSTEPYNWQYDMYTEWADYPANSTGFTMQFYVGLEGYEEGELVNYFGNQISFIKDSALGQTGVFDEPELAKCEEFYSQFLLGHWSSNYTVT